MRYNLLTALGLAILATSGPSHAAETAHAALADPSGASVGSVSLRETPHGVMLDVDLTGLPGGTHAFHIHATGACAPDFTAAGGHYNPAGHKHGIDNPEGKHAGDMPNIHVPESGALRFEVLASEVTLKADAPNTLFDADGSAIVIHAGPDDYASDPAGDAGARIACGVVAK